VGGFPIHARYCLTFLVLAAAWGVLALASWEYGVWFVIPPLYVGVPFALLAVAYAGAGPWLLCKRPSGRRSFLGWVLFAPYILLSAVTLRVYRLVSREPPYVQVAPNLFFGRRLLASEAKAAGWQSVLDLAVEFSATWVPARYLSLPVLDAMAPSEVELRAAVAWIAEAVQCGMVYVHCALGHGRSACVIIAYLLSVGKVRSVAEGIRLLQSLRPGVRLYPPQYRLLRRFEASQKQLVANGAEYN
jgi:predicted protein tyrosine phosphatase